MVTEPHQQLGSARCGLLGSGGICTPLISREKERKNNTEEEERNSREEEKK